LRISPEALMKAGIDRGDGVRVIDATAFGDEVFSRLRELLRRPEPSRRRDRGGPGAPKGKDQAPGEHLIVMEAETGQALTPDLAQSVREAVAAAFGPDAEIVLVSGADPMVGRTLRQVAERVPEVVRARRDAMTEKNIDALVDLFLTEDPIAEARHAIEADNARERARFVTEVACLTSKQVAENAGHRASNPSVTGSRWKSQGKVFSVPWKGGDLFPAFQFRDGQPHPNVGKVLRVLPEGLSPWQVAFWFTSSNGWLRGATPAERLDDEAALVAAAERESEAIVG
jgi:hypothetical protein